MAVATIWAIASPRQRKHAGATLLAGELCYRRAGARVGVPRVVAGEWDGSRDMSLEICPVMP